MKTFFNNADFRAYLELVVEFRDIAGVEIWAYCLMPNHVHLAVVPRSQESLAIFFRHVHRHYTRRINARERWTGHLWQERFHSFAMDEAHLLAAVRYTELNPVRARLCEHPEDWPWSSVHAHLAKADDAIVAVQPMLQRTADWSSYLSHDANEVELVKLRTHGKTGRPAGNEAFLDQLQALTGKRFLRRKPGPPARNK